MTLRDHFLQDPFFSSSWSDMEKVKEHFAKQTQIMSQSFEDSWSKRERSVSENADKQNNSTVVSSGNSSGLRRLLMPRQWMMPKLFDESKMEISLNTSGYKPSELKVNVSDGEISIEGK